MIYMLILKHPANPVLTLSFDRTGDDRFTNAIFRS